MGLLHGLVMRVAGLLVGAARLPVVGVFRLRLLQAMALLPGIHFGGRGGQGDAGAADAIGKVLG